MSTTEQPDAAANDPSVPGLSGPEPVAPPRPDAAPAAAGEKEWWDDPSLPWRHKPEKADIWCMSAMGFVAVYTLVMIPLRPAVLALSPHVVGGLGYRTGLILIGAMASQGDPWWPLIWILGAAMAMKFDWIYWWDGRLWGRNIVDMWAANKSKRTQRIYDRAWDLTHRYETLAIVLTFLPIPLPAGVIYAALGAAGTTLRKFLTVGALSSLVTTAGYLYLGYLFGAPAVELFDVYGKYLWYLSIALLVGMLVVYFWKARRKAPTP